MHNKGWFVNEMKYKKLDEQMKFMNEHRTMEYARNIFIQVKWDTISLKDGILKLREPRRQVPEALQTVMDNSIQGEGLV